MAVCECDTCAKLRTLLIEVDEHLNRIAGVAPPPDGGAYPIELRVKILNAINNTSPEAIRTRGR